MNAILDELSDPDSKLGFAEQPFKVTLVEDTFWRDTEESRSAAAAWNTRKVQEAASEQNQRGEYNDLKNHLDSKYVENIRWEENQKYKNSKEMIPKCKGIVQVSTLLAQAIPVQMDRTYTKDFARAFPRVSKKATERLWKSARTITSAIAPHANTILHLADYIQSSWGSIPDRENYRVLKKYSKSGFCTKTAAESKPYVYNKFGSRGTVDGAINHEFLSVIMQALLRHTMSFDEDTGIQKFDFSVAEIENLWDTVRGDILNVCEKLFNDLYPRSGYRMVPLLDNSSVWDRVDEVVQKAVMSNLISKLSSKAAV
jgi:hypothetical protein